MSWSFFGTGHGKRQWDGASAIVKIEQRHNLERKLENAQDCVKFPISTMSTCMLNLYERLKPLYQDYFRMYTLNRLIDQTCILVKILLVQASFMQFMHLHLLTQQGSWQDLLLVSIHHALKKISKIAEIKATFLNGSLSSYNLKIRTLCMTILKKMQKQAWMA
jgi:hypothetical protein